MKVHITNETTDKPYGGGNQFLRLLKRRLTDKDAYTDDPALANIILFNSHQNVEKIIHLRRSYPNKLFVHRIDGPMRLYNKLDDTRDHIVNQLNYSIANATVFQSVWSKEKNIEMGLVLNSPFKVICNAANKNIFYKETIENKREKISIVSTSFSPNIRKGFHCYSFLDQTLDFKKYNYCFAGNSPVKFSNIELLGCLTTQQIADKLRESDIFITASENDPCSNSLIEAITCEVPVLALNSGGHTEIVKNDFFLFETREELVDKIELISQDIDKHRGVVKAKQEDDTVNEYLSFFEKLLR